MSGYLNALLRASGLAGAHQPAPQRLDTEPVTEVLQSQDGHEPTPAAASVERGSAVIPAREIHTQAADRRADPAYSRADSPAAAALESEPPAANDVANNAQNNAADNAANNARTATRVVAPPPAPAAVIATPLSLTKTPAPAAPVRPVPRGMDAVRAAIRWVAADPHVAPDVSRGIPDLVVDHTTPAAESPPPRQPEQAVSRRDEKPQAPPALTIERGRDAQLELQTRRATTRAAAADENAVEISIGAIHVKVDAPPAQTALRSPAPAARGPAPARITPRAALARRALRKM